MWSLLLQSSPAKTAGAKGGCALHAAARGAFAGLTALPALSADGVPTAVFPGADGTLYAYQARRAAHARRP